MRREEDKLNVFCESQYLEVMRSYAIRQAQYEYAAAYETEKSKKFLKDYIDAIAPIIKLSGLYLGCVLGITVGIIELGTIVGYSLKTMHDIYNKGDLIDPDVVEGCEQYGQKSVGCETGRSFIEWADPTKKKEEINRGYLMVAETYLGGLASWAGRGIGLGLSTVVLAIASLIIFPIYFIAKRVAAYEEGRGEFEKLDSSNKETLQTEKYKSLIAGSQKFGFFPNVSNPNLSEVKNSGSSLLLQAKK